MRDSGRCKLSESGPSAPQSERRESGRLSHVSDHAMPTKITAGVLADSTYCVYKAYLHLNDQNGTRSDYEKFQLEARSALALKAQKKIIERYRDCKIATNIALTRSFLKQEASFIIGIT